MANTPITIAGILVLARSGTSPRTKALQGIFFPENPTYGEGPEEAARFEADMQKARQQYFGDTAIAITGIVSVTL